MSYFSLNKNETTIEALIRDDIFNEVGNTVAKYFISKPLSIRAYDESGNENEQANRNLDKIFRANKWKQNILYPLIYNQIVTSDSASIIYGNTRTKLRIGTPITKSLDAGELLRMRIQYSPSTIGNSKVMRIDEIGPGTMTREVQSLDPKEEVSWDEYVERSDSQNLDEEVIYSENNSTLVAGEYFPNIIRAFEDGALSKSNELSFVEYQITALAVQFKAILDELDNNKTGIIFLKKGVRPTDANQVAKSIWNNFQSNSGAIALDSTMIDKKGSGSRLPWEVMKADPRFESFTTLYDWTKNKILKRIGLGQDLEKSGTFNATTAEINATTGSTGLIDMKGQFFAELLEEYILKIIRYDEFEIGVDYGLGVDRIVIEFDKDRLTETQTAQPETEITPIKGDENV